MKNFLSIFRNLRVPLVFAMFATILFSCSLFEEEEPFVEKCELEKTGSVIVHNETGETIIVDVTEGDDLVNNERTIYEGGSTIYLDILAGNIKIWVSFDGENWAYYGPRLEVCEEMEYTWDYRVKEILDP